MGGDSQPILQRSRFAATHNFLRLRSFLKERTNLSVTPRGVCGIYGYVRNLGSGRIRKRGECRGSRGPPWGAGSSCHESLCLPRFRLCDNSGPYRVICASGSLAA
jgi:hypothetical protein